MVPMSQQSARLDAESALDKRQPGVSSSNGGQCYAQYLVVCGCAGLPRITVMRILLAMLATPATACEPTSFPTSGSPETHLTSPSRSLVHGQWFAFSKHQSKKCRRDVQPQRLPMRLGKNRGERHKKKTSESTTLLSSALLTSSIKRSKTAECKARCAC